MEANLETVYIKGFSGVAGSTAGAAVFSLWKSFVFVKERHSKFETDTLTFHNVRFDHYSLKLYIGRLYRIISLKKGCKHCIVQISDIPFKSKVSWYMSIVLANASLPLAMAYGFCISVYKD